MQASSSTSVLSEKQVNRALRVIILAGVLGMLFFMTVTAGPIALMLEALGASGMAIGATATLFQLGMLAQIPAAFLSERMRHRKPLWAVASLISRSLFIIPAILLLLAPEKTEAAILTTIIICGVFSVGTQMTSPCWFSWLADLIPDDRRDMFWSRRQGYIMAISILAVAFTGWFLDLFPAPSLKGFAWLLVLSSLSGVIDTLTHMTVPEPLATPANRTLSIWKRIRQPFHSRDFLFFTLAMSVWMFGLGLFTPFTNVYLKETFNTSYTHISAIQIVNMASGVVASFLAARFVKRVGVRSFTLAMISIAPLFSIPWFFLQANEAITLPLVGTISQPVLMLIATALFGGGIYANMAMLQLNLLTALAPAEGRTMAMAVHWFTVGLISALGPLTGGWLKDWIAAHPLPLTLPGDIALSYIQLILILHALVIWLIAVPLLRKIRPKHEEWPVNKALLHIFILSPLRSLRNILTSFPLLPKP